MTATRSGVAASTAADALCALANAGFLRIFDGEQPVSADTSLSGQTLLAELVFSNPAFASASDGNASANAIAPEDSCLADGTATWFRVYASDGTTPIFDGSVGNTGEDLNIDEVALTIGDPFTVTAFVFSESLFAEIP